MDSNRTVIRRKLLTILFSLAFFLPFLISGQDKSAQQANLKKIAEETNKANVIQQARVVEFATRKNLPVSFIDDKGNNVVMIGVTSNDQPIYISTNNAGAAVTTGVDKLRPGGSLGLNLEGNGLSVGIWDGGSVRDTHKEIKTRITSTSGPSLSDHATHVTGTILATGLNPLAKGMAPKATASTYYFNNDLPVIAANASSMILSNHSYGLITGWYFNNNVWTWYGDPGVSNAEDYRFGYYGDRAKSIDQIMYNAPNYIAVWAAGNERTDTGTAGHPADCNSGSGYDCISPDAVAKNIITVGAVSKVPNYVDASSVQMSSFSSWGPTDDGRIKPDLVGAGVSLFSIYSTNDSSYATLSGTSMASPNVTGSLLLLHELYKNLHAGVFMKAATLRALAIHTTKEAGTNPGPDYSFGWGLLDDEAAAKVLLGQNQKDVVVTEEVLNNNQTYELILKPKRNQKITATLVWTDPAGTSPPISLDPTNIMLVNDLDMRLVDDANNMIAPWILDPANPTIGATKGDNFRDNVEKIEFETPEPRTYRLRIKSKNSLVNNSQAFSLILTYQSMADNNRELYWVGGPGEWHDPTHWSLTSNGVPALVVPGATDHVIFDENSFATDGSIIMLSSDAVCYSFTWLEKQTASIALNGHTILIDNDLLSSSDKFLVSSAGNFSFSGATIKNNAISVINADLSKANFIINGPAAIWTVQGNLNVGGIDVQAGSLSAAGINMITQSITAMSAATKTLTLDKTVVDGLKSLSLNSASLTFSGKATIMNLATGTVSSPTTITNNNLKLPAKIVSPSGSVKFVGSGQFQNVDITGPLELTNNETFDTLRIGPGSAITLAAGTTSAFGKTTSFASTSAQPIALTSPGSATMDFSGHYRLCFDNLSISGVNLSGDASVNAGQNSTLINAANWQNVACDQVLFPDFDVTAVCVNAFTTFTDKSQGSIDAWAWDFGDATNTAGSTKKNSFHKYTTAKTYAAKLTITKGAVSKSYTQNVLIGANTISDNQIVQTPTGFFSVNAATSYQWYKNDDVISGANARSYTWDGSSGAYLVVISDGTCNLPSTPIVVTALESGSLDPARNLVYPNPSKTGEFFLQLEKQSLPVQATVYDVLGHAMLNKQITNDDQKIQLEPVPGIYLLRLTNEKISITYKIEIIK